MIQITDDSEACAPGHAGIFCAECEAGSYNPFGFSAGNGSGSMGFPHREQLRPEGPLNLTAQYNA